MFFALKKYGHVYLKSDGHTFGKSMSQLEYKDYKVTIYPTLGVEIYCNFHFNILKKPSVCSAQLYTSPQQTTFLRSLCSACQALREISRAKLIRYSARLLMFAGRLEAPKHLLPRLLEFDQASRDDETLSLAHLTIALLSDPASRSSRQSTAPQEDRYRDDLQGSATESHEDSLQSLDNSELDDSRGVDKAKGSTRLQEWAALHLAYAESRDDAAKERIICGMGHCVAKLLRQGDQCSSILDSFLSTVQKACNPAEAASIRLCGKQALQQSGQSHL